MTVRRRFGTRKRALRSTEETSSTTGQVPGSTHISPPLIRNSSHVTPPHPPLPHSAEVQKVNKKGPLHLVFMQRAFRKRCAIQPLNSRQAQFAKVILRFPETKSAPSVFLPTRTLGKIMLLRKLLMSTSNSSPLILTFSFVTSTLGR